MLTRTFILMSGQLKPWPNSMVGQEFPFCIEEQQIFKIVCKVGDQFDYDSL